MNVSAIPPLSLSQFQSVFPTGVTALPAVAFRGPDPAALIVPTPTPTPDPAPAPVALPVPPPPLPQPVVPSPTQILNTRQTETLAADALKARILASDTEAAVLLQDLSPSRAVPGGIQAALLLGTLNAGATATLLSGGMVGFWQGPPPDLAEAIIAYHFRKQLDLTVNKTLAAPALSDEPGQPSEGNAALPSPTLPEPGPALEPMDPEPPAGTLDLLD